MELQLLKTTPSPSPLFGSNTLEDLVIFKAGMVQFATFAKYVRGALSEELFQVNSQFRLTLSIDI